MCGASLKETNPLGTRFVSSYNTDACIRAMRMQAVATQPGKISERMRPEVQIRQTDKLRQNYVPLIHACFCIYWKNRVVPPAQ